MLQLLQIISRGTDSEGHARHLVLKQNIAHNVISCCETGHKPRNQGRLVLKEVDKNNNTNDGSTA